MANDSINHMPDLRRKGLPIECFSGTKVTTNPNHWYHFGCPVYVLDDKLQSGQKINKWSERARVGIYLGYSPQHARTVALILSLLTGLVSPQFHVRADTQFQTLRKAFDNGYPKLQWQDKCHFTQEDAQAKQQMQDEDMPPPEGAQILPNESQGTANDSASQGETQDTMSGLLLQHPIVPPQQDSFMPAQNSQVQETPQDMTGLH